MRTSRFFPVAILAVVLSAIAGGALGGSLMARQDEVAQQYRIFTSALDAVAKEYVDELPPDRLVYGAIDGMLKQLDPHSSFFDPRSYRQMRERQHGIYYGLGIQIQSPDGDITVMSVFEDSPAYKKGLRRGDIIARIKSTNQLPESDKGKVIKPDADGWYDAKGFTSDQAVALLKGDKGTVVSVSIKRRAFDGLIDLEIERDAVNMKTVRGAFMIDKDTGYVKLGDFSETSNEEIGVALKALSGKGMKRLMLDLRDNPGGPLEQAIRISNRFLPKGELIALHQRPDAGLERGIPRDRGQRLHAPAARGARHDGVIWGGEFLVADLESYERVGHLAAVALPGGVRAIKEPWRMAMAWARTALGREEAERYGRSVDERWPSILAIIEREDSLRTTSAGRLFDGVAALLGIRPTVTYEAQAAIELEAAAAGQPLEAEANGFSGGWEVDRGTGSRRPGGRRPVTAGGPGGRRARPGTPVPAIAAAFHVGLGNAVADVAADLASTADVGVVALSGGVFQNARLTEIVERRLTRRRTRGPRPLEGAAQRRRGEHRAGGRGRPPRASDGPGVPGPTWGGWPRTRSRRCPSPSGRPSWR